MFIVFEGIDNSGKTTQCDLLYEHLLKENKHVRLVRDPGTTKVGELIRIILRDEPADPITRMFLYQAARSELSRYIKVALREGNIVISDRYYYSSVAYQVYGDKIESPIINNLNLLSVYNQVPDLVFILDLPLQTAIRRNPDIPKDKVLRILRGYQSFNNVVRIDATQTIEEVHKIVVKAVEDIMSQTVKS